MAIAGRYSVALDYLAPLPQLILVTKFLFFLRNSFCDCSTLHTKATSLSSLLLLLLLSHFSRVRLCATHRWQPTRLPCPWDSPGKNTGVGCHFLIQCMKVKSESEVAQSYPTLSDPTDSTQAQIATYSGGSQGCNQNPLWL